MPEPYLILTQFYWPEALGSAPYLTDIAEWLVLQGNQVDVVTARPHYPEYRVYPGYGSGARDRERVGNVSIRRLSTPVGGKSGFVSRLLLEAWLSIQVVGNLALRRIRRRGRVLSLCPSILMILAGNLATRHGGTHVALVHDIQSGLAKGLRMVSARFLAKWIEGTERFVLNRTEHVVVLTNRMREALIQLGVKTPITVLPIWVDTDELRFTEVSSEASPTLLYSGNLGRKQGLFQLLEMARIVQRRRPDVSIVIRGEGSQSEPLKARSSELGLENVHFAKPVPREKLNESLSEALLHLVPQARDGADFAVPSKVYSIMAAGRPAVCTADPGSDLWNLAHESGGLRCVSPDAPDAMAETVLELLDSPTTRRTMGLSARAYVESHVAKDNVLSKLASLYVLGAQERNETA